MLLGIYCLEHETCVSHYLYPSFVLPLFIQLNIQARTIHQLTYLFCLSTLEYSWVKLTTMEYSWVKCYIAILCACGFIRNLRNTLIGVCGHCRLGTPNLVVTLVNANNHRRHHHQNHYKHQTFCQTTHLIWYHWVDYLLEGEHSCHDTFR